MAIKLNGAGVSHANGLISSGSIDFDSPWSFAGDDGNAFLGSGGDDWATFGSWFLAINDAENDKTKGHWEYPFGKGGKIYASAVRAIRTRAAQQNEDDVFNSAGHLLDAINAKKPKASPAGMQRAYATLQIKAVDPVQRTITGIATTPTPDRMGDIVVSEGAKFKLPIPFLWQHDADQPVGNVIDAKVSPGGITVTCQFTQNTGVPTLDQRLDEAFAMVQTGLVRGLSIGFMPVETAQIEGSWSCKFLEWEWLELSAVTIPANAEATINTIKRADRAVLQAKGLLGKNPVVRLSAAVAATRTGAPAPAAFTTKGLETMNIAERIASLEATRAAKANAATAIMEKAANEGRTLDAQEQSGFDDVSAEIDAIDADLTRCRTVERLQAGSATAIRGVAGITDPAAASAARAPLTVPATVRTLEKLDKGVRFARVARCLALERMVRGSSALAIAQHRYPQDDAVYRVVKAAVDAATVGNSDWAGALVGAESTVFADFAEFLRPLTIVGQFGTGAIPGLRKVPFRTRLLGQTGGGSGYWVGEAKAIPLTRADFQGTTLTPLKVASIMVSSMEELRDSSPSADVAFRNDLGKALAARMDMDFIDPNKSASAGISPASITNGVSPVASSGNDINAVREDVRNLIDFFIGQNNQIANGVFIMPQKTATALSLMVTTLDVPAFPQMTPRGGTFLGFPVIASEYVLFDSNGAHVFFVNADDIYFADDGDTVVDMSADASLEMSDAPGQDASTGGGASMVSMWQTGTVAYRAIRTVNWAPRVGRNPVAAINDVNWGNVASS